jgi:hypothetical protein
VTAAAARGRKRDGVRIEPTGDEGDQTHP